MASQSIKAVEGTPQPWKDSDESARPIDGLYGELCRLEVLQRAFAEVKEDSRRCGVEPAVLEGVERQGAEKFLGRLSKELEARAFPSAERPAAAGQPGGPSPERLVLRTCVVQAALRGIVERVFVSDPPCERVARPESSKGVGTEAVAKWLSAAIGRGLTRGFAMAFEQNATFAAERVVEQAGQRIADADFLGLLRHLLEERGPGGADMLAEAADNIVLHGIDRVLHQARTLARQGSVVHATAGRFGRDVIVLAANEAEYDWLIPAVRKRLDEAAAALKLGFDVEKTQVVDLTRGEKLRFLGYELHLVKGRDGKAKVECKQVETPAAKTVEEPAKVQQGPAPGAQPRQGVRLRFVVAACLLVALTGMLVWANMGGPRRQQLYPARGQVMLDGKPAFGALVVLHGTGKSKTLKEKPSGLVAEDGSFVLGTYKESDGAPPGTYTVTVTMELSKTEVIRPSLKKRAARFPKIYGDYEKTELTATVREEPNTLPAFELQTPKKPAAKKPPPKTPS